MRLPLVTTFEVVTKDNPEEQLLESKGYRFFIWKYKPKKVSLGMKFYNKALPFYKCYSNI